MRGNVAGAVDCAAKPPAVVGRVSGSKTDPRRYNKLSSVG